MSKNLFITATEARSGKSAVSLGIMELLLRNIGKVGFFRRLIDVDSTGKKRDNDIDLFASYFDLGIPYEKMFAYTVTEANNLLGHGRQDELLEGIFNAYKEIEKDNDFILCEGIELEGSGSSFEFDINAEISNNLGCPILLVANAHNKTVDETIRSIQVYNKSFIHKGCDVIATVVNRINPGDRDEIIDRLQQEGPGAGQLV
ncbi:MAG: AAA family ATPase, partial [Deltaproteobacteria bacterium]|nr:AAA family ATPase [Deltaproteobacteria bacterium]